MTLPTTPKTLLGPDGRPISSENFVNKKAASPPKGEAFGNWAGRDVEYLTLPGGGVVQFDLSKLTLTDFRQMRDHYQINVSLSVLSFMQHQSDWHIECEDKKITELCERQLAEVWTQLNRAMSQSNWAGFSPNVLQWENDINGREVVLTKIKDLYPEECEVNWKLVDGWAPPGRTPPKFKVFDGIKQWGAGWPIPVSNSFWYPILMENGDYKGRKLLKPAFTSWFFSILLHLFANRYYERFGEPTPVGRAPYDENLTLPSGDEMSGAEFMLQLLANLRSRGVVTLPNQRTQISDSQSVYDYDIEYLESQMRGADFERYMTRLDEEMSLGLFTPILLMRTADVGSYNLGVGHMQMYLWMMNAMNGDRKGYIDKYILSRMVDFNFSEKAPRAKIVFRKLGHSDAALLTAVVNQMMSSGRMEPDIQELGQLAGMTFKEIEGTVGNDQGAADGEDGSAPSTGAGQRGTRGSGDPKSGENRARCSATVTDIVNRVTPQVENAFKDGRFTSDLKLNMGFKRKMVDSLATDGYSNASARADRLYNRMDLWIQDQLVFADEFNSASEFVDRFKTMLDMQVSEVTDEWA